MGPQIGRTAVLKMYSVLETPDPSVPRRSDHHESAICVPDKEQRQPPNGMETWPALGPRLLSSVSFCGNVRASKGDYLVDFNTALARVGSISQETPTGSISGVMAKLTVGELDV